MERLRHVLFALLCTATVIACDGPVEPVVQEPPQQPADECPGCLPKSFDLRLDTLIVLGMTRDSARRRDIVQPNARVIVRVSNVGDSISNPVTYYVSGAFDTLPGIPPRTTRADTFTLDLGGSENQLRRLFAQSVFVSISSSGETDSERNSTSRPGLYVARAALAVIAVPAASAHQINSPVVGSYVVRNDGYVASTPETLVGCLHEVLVLCAPRYRTTFGRFQIPALEPGQTFVMAESVVVPPSAAWQDEEYQYRTSFCRAGPDPNYVTPSLGCLDGGSLLLQPDYASCNPPVLVIDQPRTFSSFNCGFLPGPVGGSGQLTDRAFHLLAMDVVAGQSYRVEGVREDVPLRIYRPDGSQLEDSAPQNHVFSIPWTGRVYIVVYSGVPTLTVTVRL